MEQRLDPGRRDLEGSAKVCGSSSRGRAVEIAVAASNQSCGGISSVGRRATEPVKYCLCAGRRDLEHDAGVIETTAGGRTVKISIAAFDQSPDRAASVGRWVKRMNKRQCRRTACNGNTSDI